jgi:ribosomal protein S18 acetylase RimI-like enzyme
MTKLRRQDLRSSRAAAALDAIAGWIPAGPYTGALHPGDIGWALRFDDLTVQMWLDDGEPVAVGFADGPVSRIALAPGFDGLDLEPELLRWCDGIDALAGRPGWTIDPGEPWLHLGKELTPVTGDHPDLDPADAADRVAVQRSAFERSTFTLERWKTMRASPAGPSCVEVLVRTPPGEPAAAVTGWLAVPGRCALIEPMGTHPAHRGKGYGRQALLAICDALASRAASAVSVLTPSTNVAAVALYRSAGFTVTGERRDSRRA